MKSSIEDLESRGYINEKNYIIETALSNREIKLLLFSEIPTDRTKASILISIKKDIEFIPLLIVALKKEKKLYCKNSICKSLGCFGKKSITILIPHLGMLGNNQHNKLPSKPFRKNSYPLPRDIIARTLVKMGTDVIPELINSITKCKLSRNQIREGIDVLGHVSFNHNDERAKETLIKLFENNDNDSVMIWKLIRSFSAFNNLKMKNKLEMTLLNSKEEAFVWEAKRSLRLMGNFNQ